MTTIHEIAKEAVPSDAASMAVAAKKMKAVNYGDTQLRGHCVIALVTLLVSPESLVWRSKIGG